MKVSHQAKYAVITAVTTALTFILMMYWRWAGSLTYISAVVSTLTVTKHVGTLLRNIWSILYGSFWASVFGACAGYFWRSPMVELLLIFVGICWVNKCTLWNPISKTFGGLIFLLSVLLPVMTSGIVAGPGLAPVLILLAVVPAILTGIVLMIPCPRLAFYQCRTDLLRLLHLLCGVTDAYVNAFCSPGETDLHLSLADGYVEDIRGLLNAITVLSVDVKTESILFKELAPFSAMLLRLLPLLGRLMRDLEGVRATVPQLTPNETHKMFVSALIGPLTNVSNEIRVSLLQVVTGHALAVQVAFPLMHTCRRMCGWITTCVHRASDSFMGLLCWDKRQGFLCRCVSCHRWSRSALPFCRCCRDPADMELTPSDASEDDASAAHRRRSLTCDEGDGAEGLHRLRECRDAVLKANHFAREAYVFVRPPATSSEGGIEQGSGSDSLLRADFASYCPDDVRAAVADDISSEGAPRRANSMDDESIASLTQNDDDIELQSCYKTESHGGRGASLSVSSSPIARERERTRSVSKDLSIYLTPVRDTISGVCSTKASVLYYDNIRLGSRNLIPRGAFICRLMTLVDTVSEIVAAVSISVDNDEVKQGSMFFLIVDSIKVQSQYFWSCASEPSRILRSGMTLLASSMHSGVCARLCACVPISKRSEMATDESHRTAAILEAKVYLTKYIHPVKLALITATASLLVLVPMLRDMFPYGLWGAVVVTLIRQENSASSFHKGCQRIEGTVVGCIFAYLASQWMQCDLEDCNQLMATSVAVVWIGVCSYFRWNDKYGYAAVVAGFTPIVIMLGPTRGSQDSAWGRVEMTFIGVALYLLIDNLLVPDRSDYALRDHAVTAVTLVRSILSTTTRVMNMLTVGADGVNAVGADGESAGGNGGSSMIPGEEENITRIFATLASCLHSAESDLTKLAANVAVQKSLLDLVIYEPRLQLRPFPLTVYAKLLVCLEKISVSSRSLCTAITAVGNSIHNMSTEEVISNFRALKSMNAHMGEVLTLAERALHGYFSAAVMSIVLSAKDRTLLPPSSRFLEWLKCISLVMMKSFATTISSRHTAAGQKEPVPE